jgi:flagellar hook protein FlgE
MAFLTSLFAGVSGLKNHQLMMDVIGNNIANVNTVGYKKGRASFVDMFSQTIQDGSQPTATTGGKNPMQIGLGMSVGSIDMDTSQGSFQSTGFPSDMAIQGSGYFIVNQGGKTLYTRDGDFNMDPDGNFASRSTGAIIQGRIADANGNIPSGAPLQNIVIRQDMTSPAKATANASFSGVLDSDTPAGGTTTSSQLVYDSLGAPHQLTLKFTHGAVGSNSWTWAASVTDGTTAATGTATFNGDGSLNSFTGSPVAITPTGGAVAMSVNVTVGTPSLTMPGNHDGITQTSGGGAGSNVYAMKQDGWAAGKLLGTTVNSDGTITGSFSNNQPLILAQIVLANFTNPSGLNRVGGNEFDVSANSGAATMVTAGTNQTIETGVLEQSNVDLADEFTKMITAQRGFQANARVITVSDQFLDEVVALKR